MSESNVIENALEAVKSGDPEQAREALMAALDGKELPKYVDTGVVVATPDNMGQPKMMELHSPDLSRWLKE